MSLDLETITSHCCVLAAQVAQYIQGEIHHIKEGDVVTKDQNSFVTYVDKQAEIQLIRGLLEILPEASFITEEGMIDNEDSELAWVVDPLDGTTNFLYGIPAYAISIALKSNDQILAGVIYGSPHRECFYAWDKGGAFRNGERIRVNNTQNIEEALIGTGFPYRKEIRLEKPYRIMGALLGRCRGLRRLGSAALDLAYVACGRLDGYYEAYLNPWDVAAGAKIVGEAGGTVSDYEGADRWITGSSIIAANPVLQSEMLQIIRQA